MDKLNLTFKGGNNYQIFAFRVNKQIMKLGQLFV